MTVLVFAWGVFPTPVNAQPPSASSSAPPSPSGSAEVPALLDRVVVRFTSPETGGIDAPRFVLERELAFAARLEALADPTFQPGADEPFRPAHLRSALERLIAETILEALEVSPQPTERDIQARVNAAQAALAQRVGGAVALTEAARGEGLGPLEIFRLLQRQARASLYLDRMVAPMLRPSDAELRALHRSGRTPFSKQPYEEVQVALGRWYVSKRLGEAVFAYYEGARTRLNIQFVDPL
jgi:hypothetical protein